MDFSMFSDNNDVQEYIELMVSYIFNHSSLSIVDTYMLFLTDKARIIKLFDPYPETILSQDPEKYAEMLATSWGILDEPELTFS